MNMTCNMTKDLLDLYIEKNLSTDSLTAVEEHLQSCPDCMALFENKRNQAPKKPQIKFEVNGIDDVIIDKNLKLLSKRLKTRKIINIISGVFMALLTVSACLYGLIKKYED